MPLRSIKDWSRSHLSNVELGRSNPPKEIIHTYAAHFPDSNLERIVELFNAAKIANGESSQVLSIDDLSERGISRRSTIYEPPAELFPIKRISVSVQILDYNAAAITSIFYIEDPDESPAISFGTPSEVRARTTRTTVGDDCAQIRSFPSIAGTHWTVLEPKQQVGPATVTVTRRVSLDLRRRDAIFAMAPAVERRTELDITIYLAIDLILDGVESFFSHIDSPTYSSHMPDLMKTRRTREFSYTTTLTTPRVAIGTTIRTQSSREVILRPTLALLDLI